MEKKTKTCKHCKEEIAKDAKKCPKCGGKQGLPGIVKALIVVVIVIVCIVGCMSSCASGVDKAVKEVSSGYDDQSGKSSFKVGEVFQSKHLKITFSCSILNIAIKITCFYICILLYFQQSMFYYRCFSSACISHYYCVKYFVIAQ